MLYSLYFLTTQIRFTRHKTGVRETVFEGAPAFVRRSRDHINYAKQNKFLLNLVGSEQSLNWCVFALLGGCSCGTEIG